MTPRWPIERHDVVDSTMAVARQRAKEGAPSGTTVVAGRQSAGRGRLGRPWFSPSGAGLWLTSIVRPGPRADGSSVTLAGLVAGVAAGAAARRLGAAGAMLKWPNDVVVDERKLCGILIEGEDVAGPAPLLLVGVGFNLAARATLELPAELETRYVGLADLVPDAEDAGVERALEVMVGELAAWLERWESGGARPVLEAWARLDSLAGHEVRVEGAAGVVVGRAEGLSGAGTLRVRTAAGVAEIAAGEVHRLRVAR